MHCVARVAGPRMRRWLLVVAALTFFATGVPAEVSQVYRWLDTDGRPVFSDAPPPKGTAHTVYRIRTADDARVESDAPSTQACDSGSPAQRASAHRDDVAEARANLSRARERMDEGQEPLPGERLGNAGGGSRLVPDYFARQDALEAQVRQAEAQLGQARRRQVQSADRIAPEC